MRKEFVMRGKTASDGEEVLNFGKYKQGYAYKMTEFRLWPTSVGTVNIELCGSVTAAKTAEDPANPDFSNDGLIGVALFQINSSMVRPTDSFSMVNDTYLITQNLILKVVDTEVGAPQPANWQCRFESVKMTGPEEAATNYKQFAISDE